MKIQRDTMLGLVFFGGLALLGWATVNLTSLSFDPKPTKTIYFQEAQGLREGDPVYVLGTRFGQVLEVALVEDGDKPPIVVTIELDGEMQLAQNKKIRIRQASLLGGSQIDIDPGSADEPAASPLKGTIQRSALDALGEADVIGTISSVKRFFDKLTDTEGSVGALLDDRAIYDDMAAAMGSARRSLEQIERGDGPLGRIIHSRVMAEDLSVMVHELREIMHKINEGAGLASRVVNDAELAADLAGSVSDVHALTSATRRGDGVIGKLFIDGEWAEDVGESLESIRSFTAKIDDPNSGLVGALLADPDIREDTRRILANVADATDQVREGRGLLGKLFYDEEMAEKLERVFTQVSGAIEDVREAAPVGTFFQVLATPF